MSKNQKSPSFYLNAVTCLVGIAGVVALVISSTMSSANALHSLPLLVALSAAGVVMVALVAAVSMGKLNNDYIGTLSTMAAIALFTVVVGSVINSRILLISGLFSYNAGNVVGWNVFYVTVASLGCFLVSVLLLIAGSFLKSRSK